MNIFITGASGLVGTELSQRLIENHANVIKLNRLSHQNQSKIPDWDLDISQNEKSVVANTIIHLAGENIAAKRWNNEQKSKIYDSRILGTKNLVNKILSLPHKPETFICASAIGFYGNRNKELLDESSSPGDDFVSKISLDWEQATLPLIECGIRVINLRFGVILSKNGGALKKMLTPFKLGLGGAIGSGQQKFSWISLDDAVNAIIYVMNKPAIEGPVNVTSPNPISNNVYTKSLAKVLNRPAIFNMPAFVCRFIFGEMADELLLSSQSVMPKKLIQNGFKFKNLSIDSALANILK